MPKEESAEKNDLTELFSGKDETPTPQLQEYVTSFYKLLMKERGLKKDLEDAKELRIAAEETLYASLEDAGWELIRTSEGTFYKKTDFFANFAPDKKEAGYAWLRELGFGDIIHETVNARTFSAFIKDFRKDEMSELPEFVSTSTKNKVGYRKK
jgi:hypothetical protein